MCMCLCVCAHNNSHFLTLPASNGKRKERKWIVIKAKNEMEKGKDQRRPPERRNQQWKRNGRKRERGRQREGGGILKCS